MPPVFVIRVCAVAAPVLALAVVRPREATLIAPTSSAAAVTSETTRSNNRTLAAIRLAARLDGMITDPVYEGKSITGLIDLVSSDNIEIP